MRLWEPGLLGAVWLCHRLDPYGPGGDGSEPRQYPVAAVRGEKACVDGRMVFQAARREDTAARRALDRYLDGLSVGLINLANVLFPEVICLGGGISAADDDLLLEPLREGSTGAASTRTFLPGW